MASRLVRFSAGALLLLAPAVAGADALRNGPLPAPLVADESWWRTDVSAAPVDPSSAAYIAFIGTNRGLHPDFGGYVTPCEIYGFPYVTVDATQPRRAVSFDYADESDGVDAAGNGVPFYPIPEAAKSECGWIEGGPAGSQDVGGDRHMLIHDTDNDYLYELYALHWDGVRWTAGSGAFFDLKTNRRRPEGWTSADAAGLAILPGLVRYDEAFGTEEISHAFRVTVRATNGYVYPASHRAGSTAGALPMGARLRLRASRDISGFAPEVRRIFEAMKRYGLIVADNGSDMYVSGVHDTRWDNDVLNPAFSALKASDFEVLQLGWVPPSDVPRIDSFTATPPLVPSGGCSTLSWSVAGGGTVRLDGATVDAHDATVRCPDATELHVLTATGVGGSASAQVTLLVDDGAATLATPTITAPSPGETVAVSGVTFAWNVVSGAAGYEARVLDAATGVGVFAGSLAGGGSTSTLVSLPDGRYLFAVRACGSSPSPASCGGYGTTTFNVRRLAPTGAPTITSPTQGATLTASTQTFSWTAVAKADPGLSLAYEVLLVDVAGGNVPQLQISVPDPNLSTVFTLHSSTQYQLKVRACQAGCGPWSTPVTFAVDLPSVPTSAPTIGSCTVTAGNSLTCTWSAVSGADAYQVQVVQPPPAGPGGGALTVAARQVSTTSVTFPVPAGGATVFLSACNGDGCGPYATTDISVPGPNPAQPNLGTPMAGTVVAGPGVLFTWNRIPGDTGSNTWYRLYVQDLSRQAAALDVYTKANYYAAYFKAEGARYDGLVVANPGLPSQVVGPAQGFNVSGSSATAPTMVAPAHNSTVAAGNVALGWSPVPGATLYEYYVGVLGGSTATARGVTPGLVAYVPLAGAVGGTSYSGIVRACPEGATCVAGSDAGWGPWSNEPGGPGVTNFTVVP